MASTAAPSPPSLSPRPTQRPAAIAAASVTRTSSRARLRSRSSVLPMSGAVGDAADVFIAVLLAEISLEILADPRRRRAGTSPSPGGTRPFAGGHPPLRRAAPAL